MSKITPTSEYTDKELLKSQERNAFIRRYYTDDKDKPMVAAHKEDHQRLSSEIKIRGLKQTPQTNRFIGRIMNKKAEEAFINGFIKAALGAGPQPIAPLGAPSQPPQPMPAPQPGGQPQPMPQQGMGGMQPPQAKVNPMFYQLLSQFKQQNPVPQVPPPVTNQHLQPKMV